MFEDLIMLNISLFMYYRENIFRIFSSNSEANASELLEKTGKYFLVTDDKSEKSFIRSKEYHEQMNV